MVKILVLSDQQSTNHSALEGIFSNYLKSLVTIVYLPKTCQIISKEGHRIFAPYRYKKKGLFNVLNELIDIDKFDIVIVRNLYPLLKQAIDERNFRKFKLGFWKSWPHTYRRFYQSKIENKSILRKFVEYKIKDYLNKSKIKQCDFFMPITSSFKDSFFSEIDIPTYSLGMGFDGNMFDCNRSTKNHTVHFVYIGTIDKIRQTLLVVKAFHQISGDFVFDLYTKSSNEEVRKIQKLIADDGRVSLKDPVDRESLPKVLCRYDIGVNFIPNDKIFNTSSPTKIYEYYASGMPALMNYNADFDNFLNENNAFISDFNLTSISRNIENIISLSLEDIAKMGIQGKVGLMHRNYKKMSQDVLSFLNNLLKR